MTFKIGYNEKAFTFLFLECLASILYLSCSNNYRLCIENDICIEWWVIDIRIDSLVFYLWAFLWILHRLWCQMWEDILIFFLDWNDAKSCSRASFSKYVYGLSDTTNALKTLFDMIWNICSKRDKIKAQNQATEMMS